MSSRNGTKTAPRTTMEELLLLSNQAQLGRIELNREVGNGQNNVTRVGGLEHIARTTSSIRLREVFRGRIDALFLGSRQLKTVGLPFIIRTFFEKQAPGGNFKTREQCQKLSEDLLREMRKVTMGGERQSQTLNSFIKQELKPMFAYMEGLSLPTEAQLALRQAKIGSNGSPGPKKPVSPAAKGLQNESPPGGDPEAMAVVSTAAAKPGSEHPPQSERSVEQRWKEDGPEARVSIVKTALIQVLGDSFQQCESLLLGVSSPVVNADEELTETDFFILDQAIKAFMAATQSAENASKEAVGAIPAYIQRSFLDVFGRMMQCVISLVKQCTEQVQKGQRSHRPHAALSEWLQSYRAAVEQNVDPLTIERLSSLVAAHTGGALDVPSFLLIEKSMFLTFDRQADAHACYKWTNRERGRVTKAFVDAAKKGKQLGVHDSTTLADDLNREMHGGLADAAGRALRQGEDVQRLVEEMERDHEISNALRRLPRLLECTLIQRVMDKLVESAREYMEKQGAFQVLQDGRKVHVIGSTTFQLAWLELIDAAVRGAIAKEALVPTEGNPQSHLDSFQQTYREKKQVLLQSVNEAVRQSFTAAGTHPDQSIIQHLNLTEQDLAGFDAVMIDPMKAQEPQPQDLRAQACAVVLPHRESDAALPLLKWEEEHLRQSLAKFLVGERRVVVTGKTYADVLEALQIPSGALPLAAEYCNAVFHGGLMLRTAQGSLAQAALTFLRRYPVASEEPTIDEEQYALGLIRVTPSLTNEDVRRKLVIQFQDQHGFARSLAFVEALVRRVRDKIAKEPQPVKPAPAPTTASVPRSGAPDPTLGIKVPAPSGIPLAVPAMQRLAPSHDTGHVERMRGVTEHFVSELERREMEAWEAAQRHIEENILTWLEEETLLGRKQAEAAFIGRLQDNELKNVTGLRSDRIRFLLLAAAEERVIWDTCNTRNVPVSLQGASVNDVANEIIAEDIGPRVYFGRKIWHERHLYRQLCNRLHAARKHHTKIDLFDYIQQRWETSFKDMTERLPAFDVQPTPPPVASAAAVVPATAPSTLPIATKAVEAGEPLAAIGGSLRPTIVSAPRVQPAEGCDTDLAHPEWTPDVLKNFARWQQYQRTCIQKKIQLFPTDATVIGLEDEFDTIEKEIRHANEQVIKTYDALKMHMKEVGRVAISLKRSKKVDYENFSRTFIRLSQFKNTVVAHDHALNSLFETSDLCEDLLARIDVMRDKSKEAEQFFKEELPAITGPLSPTELGLFDGNDKCSGNSGNEEKTLLHLEKLKNRIPSVRELCDTDYEFECIEKRADCVEQVDSVLAGMDSLYKKDFLTEFVPPPASRLLLSADESLEGIEPPIPLEGSRSGPMRSPNILSSLLRKGQPDAPDLFAPVRALLGNDAEQAFAIVLGIYCSDLCKEDGITSWNTRMRLQQLAPDLDLPKGGVRNWMMDDPIFKALESLSALHPSAESVTTLIRQKYDRNYILRNVAGCSISDDDVKDIEQMFVMFFNREQRLAFYPTAAARKFVEEHNLSLSEEQLQALSSKERPGAPEMGV